MKKISLKIVALLLSGMSYAQVPEPDEFAYEVNAKSEYVVEGKVIKRDTIYLYQKESFVISTIEIMQTFKGDISNKSLKICVKRNIEEELSTFKTNYGQIWIPLLETKYIFFLNKNGEYYKLTSVIRFLSEDEEYKACFMQTYFKTLLDVYHFLPKLPGIKVPLYCYDSSRYKIAPKPDFRTNPEHIKMIEERKKARVNNN